MQRFWVMIVSRHNYQANLRVFLFRRLEIFSEHKVYTMKTFGSRAEVFHGTAEKTTGGLSKKDLFQDKYGAIKRAKIKQGIDPKKYVMIKGKLLKEAQAIYHLLIMSK